MGTQNLLNYYFNKLDAKINYSSYYDFYLASDEKNYNTEGVAPEGRPAGLRPSERLVHLCVSRRPTHDVDSCLGIDIGPVGSALVERVGSLVVVFVAVDEEINPVLEQERLQIFPDEGSIPSAVPVA